MFTYDHKFSEKNKEGIIRSGSLAKAISQTSFECADLQVSSANFSGNEEVEKKVKNAGDRAGKKAAFST